MYYYYYYYYYYYKLGLVVSRKINRLPKQWRIHDFYKEELGLQLG